MSIETFDRASVRLLREELQTAIQAVAKHHGISLGDVSARFTSDFATFKVETAIIGADNVAKTKERAEFERHAALFGLQASDIDRAFRHNGDIYHVSGLAPRSRKYPVLAIRAGNGRTYKFPAGMVKTLLESTAEPNATAVASG